MDTACVHLGKEESDHPACHQRTVEKSPSVMKTTPDPAAAKKPTYPDPDRTASSSSQPPAPDGRGVQAHPDRGPEQRHHPAPQSPGQPTRPHHRGKNYTHPTIQSTTRLHKTIDTQVDTPKAGMVTTSPPAKEAHSLTDAPKAHIPAKHPPGPKPPQPSRNPSPEAERLQNRKPAPDPPRSSTAARPATYVSRHRLPQQRCMQPPKRHHPRATKAPSRPGPQSQC
nr:extensin-like [Paramormyrops kingsleyae]